MSFKKYKNKIDEGDTVILYLSNNLHAIEVRPVIKNKKGEMVENVYQTTFGALKVRSLIGESFGSRVELSKGWGHVLQPTPELWSLTLPHRTQIIYTPDISMILLQLDLVPGSVVIEAGTGSGSLTHALIRRVRPSGHVYTFDFHDYRAKLAQEEFEAHGLAEFVTAKHRDVLAEGFSEELNKKADAVFLDLPSPWLGVERALAAIKDEERDDEMNIFAINIPNDMCDVSSNLGSFDSVSTIYFLSYISLSTFKELSYRYFTASMVTGGLSSWMSKSHNVLPK